MVISMGLDELRKKINGIDAQLAKLFDERMEFAGMSRDIRLKTDFPFFKRTGKTK